ncbi:MAG: PilZ domain-containing protein [Candidatus Acidiferrales bacterium]
MPNGIERRASRRFTMALPLTVRSSGPNGDTERQGRTRDVSFRGLYFTVDTQYESGSALQFILTLPKEITMAGDVNILCYAQVVRVETRPDAVGVAARIDRYEFLSAPA